MLVEVLYTFFYKLLSLLNTVAKDEIAQLNSIITLSFEEFLNIFA